MKKITLPIFVVAAIAVGTMLLPASNSYAVASSGSRKVCRVILTGGTDATVVATGKSVFLPNGTALNRLPGPMHQGYIAVKAKVGAKLLTLSINVEDTNCDD